MIIKYRNKPAKIAGYEALLKRLPAHYEKRGVIQEKLNSARAGIGGEERLDRLLDFFEPPYPHLLLQDVELPDHLQIDTMMITQSCVFLLEVKNMSGILRFQENPSALHQVTPNGEIRGHKSPVIQAETAQLKVEKILKLLNFPLRVQSAIVIAYPSQIVENVPPGTKVWSADEVLVRLYNLDMPKPKISLEQMKSLGDQFLSLQQKYNPFPLAPKFDIQLQNIENGVFCPRCRLKKMDRFQRKWECKSCFLLSNDAHFEAVEEWFMLCQPTITTNQCKDFLGLSSLEAAKRLLKRMELDEIGGRRHRRYAKRI
ncbi:nuclease-related domain-containing protein [Planococcus sp. N028]|uniref:Nuclease-related domain-containing protein n=1 Tax=Planococcus shixiaomingii TaxID=3058393 RepID=A0ABT8N1K6_9BACL|nr:MULTISPECIES: nuclease-related domain-containing protein [unclassified Planococcus (in: firmicutes)]MDN7241749.1 nuclease-related domain-containing protein [Planococcus sp. N028]WKA54035.1 nuclease-related domain-containing protein [Planococcus sp. N022]